MRERLSSLSPAFLPAFGAVLLALSGCAHEVAPSGCVQDTDCFGDGEVCVDATCVVLEQVTCTSDFQCNTNAGEGCVDGVCTAGAQLSGAGGACQATRDCPVNTYCNTATSQCQPLLTGWCREAAQCTGAESLCSATSTDVPGRCVECLRDSDCGTGGSCVNPGICDLSDRGPAPDPTNDPDPGTDPGTDPAEEDACEANGWYGDSVCDTFCPQPDPDCAETGGGDTGGGGTGGTGGTGDDFCAEYGWYGDGLCDTFCPSPDPDCEATAGGGSGDICEQNDWYGDGICDENCANPDPDCAGGQDICEAYGWYGDGICDENCANPDPDCSTPTGLLENESCVQNGQLLQCAEGLDCIHDVNANGTPTYGGCKRICAANSECGGGQQCALGFLSSGEGICGTPLSENQQGCTFWEQSGSFCFGGGGGGGDSAFLECLSGTCKLICDYETNVEAPLDCPGTRQCGSNFASYEGYGVDLAVCQ